MRAVMQKGSARLDRKYLSCRAYVSPWPGNSNNGLITVTRALIVPVLRCRAQADILMKQEASMLWSAIPLPNVYLVVKSRYGVCAAQSDPRCYSLASVGSSPMAVHWIAMLMLSNVPPRCDLTVRGAEPVPLMV
jgi:hypothetical protein